jgi:alkylhydroperoxidase/carboxymuconolactone decarboxylase family protein YurZ
MKNEGAEKQENYAIIDVRKLTGNFLPGLLDKAAHVDVGKGICVIQSFEPVPLYSAMAELGFDHATKKISDDEYRVYFSRIEQKESSFKGGGDMPLKPNAVLNFKKIDNRLADTVVNFWSMIWGKEKSALDMKTKLLLSLSNGVGAGRFRQATRELIKAYSIGLSVEEMDELFSLFVWNAGVGNFASEIGPSPLFGAYQLIKDLTKKGETRNKILKVVLEKFGENNPEVNVMFQERKT